MENKSKKLKDLFHGLIQKYDLPDQNISSLLFYLADTIKQDPQNEELLQLLIMSLCAGDYLLAHFYPPQSEEDDACNYRLARKNMKKLQAAIANERLLPEAWETVKKRKTLPDAQNLLGSETEACQKEAEQLCIFYRKYIYPANKPCPELYNNLFSFCKTAHVHPELHKVSPFFFYQIMVKHTSRLATKSELQFSLKNLWNYKEYQIRRNNGKNFARYRNSTKLFLALCKYYRKDKTVDLELCRYAFSHSSNIMEWLSCYEPKKMIKCETKLYALPDKWNAASFAECWAPIEFDPLAAYHVKAKKYGYYIFGPICGNELDYTEQIEDIEIFTMNYIADHAEYIFECMHCMYRDLGKIRHMVQEIYEDAGLEKQYPSVIPVPYRMAHVYELLLECLNIAVKGRVRDVMAFLAEFGEESVRVDL